VAGGKWQVAEYFAIRNSPFATRHSQLAIRSSLFPKQRDKR